jgi:hypothetical protein
VRMLIENDVQPTRFRIGTGGGLDEYQAVAADGAGAPPLNRGVCARHGR